MNGEEIECPLHGSAFNLTTGEALTPPASESIRVFQVRIDGSDVLVGPPGELNGLGSQVLLEPL